MVLELKDKMEGLGGGTQVGRPERPVSTMSSLEQDVLSALQNLGCQRAAAEAAVRKARASGVPEEFEPLFRRALELVR
jgi:Holliday junction resolvasome RuvABC DNA-binding subunit